MLDNIKDLEQALVDAVDQEEYEAIEAALEVERARYRDMIQNCMINADDQAEYERFAAIFAELD